MAYLALVPRQFAPLLPLETRLLDALRDAASRACHNIAVGAAPASCRLVRAGFLRWLLIEAIPATRPPITEFLLQRATVAGRLDLGGSCLVVHASFRHCEFEAPIDLTEATVRGFELIAGSVPAIWADRLTALSSVLVCAAALERSSWAPVSIAGAIRMNGAHIHGNLDPLRANEDETPARREFRLEGAEGSSRICP